MRAVRGAARLRARIGALVLSSSTAYADAPRDAPTEIDVDRGDAPVGRTEFGFDGGAPVAGWGATIAGSWLESPISFGIDGGTSEPVRRRQSIILGGALTLGESVVLDARFAGSRQLGSRLRGAGSDRELDRYVPSDLRIGARLRVLAKPRISVFVRGDLGLPTGDQQDFAGDPGVSVAWRLIARATLGPGIVLAASAGLRLRGQEVLIGDRLLGNESLAAAGIALPVPALRPLWCADQVTLTADASAIIGDNVGVARGPSPVEVRVGVISRPRPAWTIGVRVGRGVTDEIGSPTLRATVELTYQGNWKLLEIAPSADNEEPGDDP